MFVLSVQWTDSVMTYIYSIFVFLKNPFTIEVIEQGQLRFSAEHQVLVEH